MTLNKSIIVFVAILLVGCGISVKDGDDVKYKNYSIISQFNAKSLPRQARLERITSDMRKVSTGRPRVSQVFDTFTDTVFNIFKHQQNIIIEHATLLDNHRDVLSFLMANKGKDKIQLQQAIQDFDKTAKNEQEKIEPKIKAYEKASDKVWQENVKLSLLITEQSLKLAHVIYQQSDDLVGIQGFSMLLNASKINDAYNLAEIRLHLAKVANEFIEDEKAIIDISKQLQSLQNAD